VHNGVQGPPSPVRPRSSIEDPVRLAFIGRISERKGVQDAVSTVGRLRRRGIEARLDVVGSIFPGYEYMERLLHESISADGTDELITFHGFVSPVWPVLESTDILLVPSRGDESFGNTAVEGLLAARPVVVTEVPGLREATEGFENVVVVPRADPEAMAAAIEGFISDWPAAVDRSMPESAMATQRYSTERYGAAIVQAVAAAVSS
jgi:glycosyltransferase involved in cell wall biosynthesis